MITPPDVVQVPDVRISIYDPKMTLLQRDVSLDLGGGSVQYEDTNVNGCGAATIMLGLLYEQIFDRGYWVAPNIVEISTGDDVIVKACVEGDTKLYVSSTTDYDPANGHDQQLLYLYDNDIGLTMFIPMLGVGSDGDGNYLLIGTPYDNGGNPATLPAYPAGTLLGRRRYCGEIVQRQRSNTKEPTAEITLVGIYNRLNYVLTNVNVQAYDIGFACYNCFAEQIDRFADVFEVLSVNFPLLGMNYGGSKNNASVLSIIDEILGAITNGDIWVLRVGHDRAPRLQKLFDGESGLYCYNVFFTQGAEIYEPLTFTSTDQDMSNVYNSILVTGDTNPATKQPFQAIVQDTQSIALIGQRDGNPVTNQACKSVEACAAYGQSLLNEYSLPAEAIEMLLYTRNQDKGDLPTYAPIVYTGNKRFDAKWWLDTAPPSSTTTTLYQTPTIAQRTGGAINGSSNTQVLPRIPASTSTLIAAVSWKKTSTNTAITPPSGWTHVADSFSNDVNGDAISLFKCPTPSGTNYTFTQVSGDTYIVVWIAEIQNFDDIVTANSVFVNPVSSFSTDPLTPSTENQLPIAVFCSGTPVGSTVTAGFVEVLSALGIANGMEVQTGPLTAKTAAADGSTGAFANVACAYNPSGTAEGCTMMILLTAAGVTVPGAGDAVGVPSLEESYAFINFNDAGTGGSTQTPYGSQQFYARFVGTFVPPTTGTYTFQCPSDDGTTFVVGTTALWDHVHEPSPDNVYSGSIDLVAGQPYDVILEWHNESQADEAILSCQVPGASSFAIFELVSAVLGTQVPISVTNGDVVMGYHNVNVTGFEADVPDTYGLATSVTSTVSVAADRSQDIKFSAVIPGWATALKERSNAVASALRTNTIVPAYLDQYVVSASADTFTFSGLTATDGSFQALFAKGSSVVTCGGNSFTLPPRATSYVWITPGNTWNIDSTYDSTKETGNIFIGIFQTDTANVIGYYFRASVGIPDASAIPGVVTNADANLVVDSSHKAPSYKQGSGGWSHNKVASSDPYCHTVGIDGTNAVFAQPGNGAEATDLGNYIGIDEAASGRDVRVYYTPIPVVAGQMYSFAAKINAKGASGGSTGGAYVAIVDSTGAASHTTVYQKVSQTHGTNGRIAGTYQAPSDGSVTEIVVLLASDSMSVNTGGYLYMAQAFFMVGTPLAGYTAGPDTPSGGTAATNAVTVTNPGTDASSLAAQPTITSSSSPPVSGSGATIEDQQPQGSLRMTDNTLYIQNSATASTPNWSPVGGEGTVVPLIPYGTAWPASPADQQVFYRTDISTLGIWDSTTSAWLTSRAALASLLDVDTSNQLPGRALVEAPTGGAYQYAFQTPGAGSTSDFEFHYSTVQEVDYVKEDDTTTYVMEDGVTPYVTEGSVSVGWYAVGGSGGSITIYRPDGTSFSVLPDGTSSSPNAFSSTSTGPVWILAYIDGMDVLHITLLSSKPNAAQLAAANQVGVVPLIASYNDQFLTGKSASGVIYGGAGSGNI